MPQYTIPLQGGGAMTVNASSYAAAQDNVRASGNTPAPGGPSTTTLAGGFDPQGSTAAMNAAGFRDDPAGRAAYAAYLAGQRGAGPGGPGASSSQNQQQAQQLGDWYQKFLEAIAAGNEEAFRESIRQFDLSFGLDRDKFNEAIRQFNVNLGISEAGLTGMYQTPQTIAAYAARNPQAAALAAQNPSLLNPAYQQELLRTRGYIFEPGEQLGQQTLAAQQQAYAQQLGAIQTAAQLQANPFRQAQVIGQLGPLLRGQGVAGFQAPGAAQGQTDFSGMGNLQRLIDDIRGGPGAVNSQSTQSVLDAIPTPAKINSPQFLRASPLTQNLVLQGMQEKYGLNPEDALAQIRNTLPQFQAPTTFGGVRR